jgi:cytoskeleton protein RodZ
MNDESAAAPEESQEREEKPTLGNRLRTARYARELSIEKIADELRIEEHVLVALEEDRLNDIKVAPVFIKGYIKQYGRLLRLDYDELRQAFHEQVDAEDVSLKPNSSIQLRDERHITVWIVAALAAALLIVALLVWWFGADEMPLFGNRSAQESEAATAVAAPVGATLRSAPTVRQPSAAATSSGARPAASDPQPVEDTAVGLAVPTNDGAESVPAATAAPAVNQTTAPSGAPVAQSTANATATATATALAPPPPGAVPMRFEFSEQSWFELQDAAGRRLFYDLADADSSLDFQALPPARVLIGNAAAAVVTVEGVAFAIPPASLRGNVASFVIDPAQD